MATAIEWIVSQMDCYPEKEGEQDVVFIVHWRCNGADGQYSGTAYGTQGVTYEAGAPFTPYADLTKAQVIGWVQASMGIERVAEIEASVSNQIENQKNPPVVSPPLPW